MNYFKHFLSVCLWLSAVGFTGCHDDVEDTSNVELGKLSPEQAQQCLEGTWRVIRQCGGVAGCVDVTGRFEEYTRDRVVSYTPDAEPEVSEIREWVKEERGYRLLFKDREAYLLLQSIRNDTLYSSNGKEDSSAFTWTAVRVKDR